MKIKKWNHKAYYTTCSRCGRGIDSDEAYIYNGMCELCWRGRNYE